MASDRQVIKNLILRAGCAEKSDCDTTLYNNYICQSPRYHVRTLLGTTPDYVHDIIISDSTKLDRDNNNDYYITATGPEFSKRYYYHLSVCD